MTLILRFTVLVTLFITSISVMSQDNQLQVVASHSILGDVINNVVGDIADVTLLIPAGADPHSFEPTPSDLTAIAKADIVFVNGAFFEEGLLESIENAGESATIIEASSCVTILAFGTNEGDHDHEAEENHMTDNEEMDTLCDQHEEELMLYNRDISITGNDTMPLGRLYAIECGEHHEDEDHADEHHHEEGSCDPHVWMNPHNVMYWTLLIRDTLIERDPANADTYRTNADTYLTELIALVDDFVIPLVETLPQDKRILIASHDSLGYLTESFGFKTVGTIMLSGSTLAEPSAQDIASIIDLIQAEGIPAIFSETTVNDNIAQTIANETGVQLVMLHSGSLSDENGTAPTYIDYIRSNYTAIIEALGGGS